MLTSRSTAVEFAARKSPFLHRAFGEDHNSAYISAPADPFCFILGLNCRDLHCVSSGWGPCSYKAMYVTRRAPPVPTNLRHLVRAPLRSYGLIEIITADHKPLRPTASATRLSEPLFGLDLSPDTPSGLASALERKPAPAASASSALTSVSSTVIKQ
jgi:hypothetical protein